MKLFKGPAQGYKEDVTISGRNSVTSGPRSCVDQVSFNTQVKTERSHDQFTKKRNIKIT